MQWVFMNLQQLELINPALWCSSKFIFALGDPNSVCLAVTWWLPFNSKSVMVHDFHWSACGVVITCLGKESFGWHWLFGGFNASAVLHLVLDSTSACSEVPVPRKRESQFDIWDMKRMKRMKRSIFVQSSWWILRESSFQKCCTIFVPFVLWAKRVQVLNLSL